MVQPTNKRLVTEAAVPGHVLTEITTPGTPTATALSATYVTYVDSVTGLPLVGKHVIITVDQTTDDIADITVEEI